MMTTTRFGISFVSPWHATHRAKQAWSWHITTEQWSIKHTVHGGKTRVLRARLKQKKWTKVHCQRSPLFLQQNWWAWRQLYTTFKSIDVHLWVVSLVSQRPCSTRTMMTVRCSLMGSAYPSDWIAMVMSPINTMAEVHISNSTLAGAPPSIWVRNCASQTPGCIISFLPPMGVFSQLFFVLTYIDAFFFLPTARSLGDIWRWTEPWKSRHLGVSDPPNVETSTRTLTTLITWWM